MGAIETGMADTVAVFRSMNGYSNIRIGGTGARASAPITGLDLMKRPYGMISAVQQFSFTFTRHMMEYGVTSENLAQIKVAHSNHASNNPKAFDEAKGDRGRRAQLPLDHPSGGPPVGLLPGNRQRHLRYRHLRGTGQRPSAAPGPHPGSPGSGNQAGRGFPLPARSIFPGLPVTTLAPAFLKAQG